MLNNGFQKEKKATRLKFVELEKELRSLERLHGTKLDQAVADIAGMARQLTACQTEHRHLEFYVEKILPIKGHSQICSALHNVLRQKDEYNNLIVFEHQQLEVMKQRLTIQRPTKRDQEKMRMVVSSKPVVEAARGFVEKLQAPAEGEGLLDGDGDDGKNTGAPIEDLKAAEYLKGLQELLEEEAVDLDVLKLRPLDDPATIEEED